ncbi:reticulon family protein [Striga asiatica]|uniref:Reticulon family protein n=1 Tax=Striga asiatica TaxID=4170 RepID=A0A5A7R1B4_STRAF|nr:reticulon family protein [Striga asiatica]
MDSVANYFRETEDKSFENKIKFGNPVSFCSSYYSTKKFVETYYEPVYRIEGSQTFNAVRKFFNRRLVKLNRVVDENNVSRLHWRLQRKTNAINVMVWVIM